MSDFMLTLILIPAAIVAWVIAIGVTFLLIACVKEVFRD